MSIFVDTSALYAVFDRDDRSHKAIARKWAAILASSRPLVTSNYVLLETTALLQRRLGLGAVRDLDEAVTPVLNVRWVTEQLHGRALARLRRVNRRALSLVDCCSFELMEEEALRDVLAVDDDFATEGFRLV